MVFLLNAGFTGGGGGGGSIYIYIYMLPPSLLSTVFRAHMYMDKSTMIVKD